MRRASYVSASCLSQFFPSDPESDGACKMTESASLTTYCNDFGPGEADLSVTASWTLPEADDRRPLASSELVGHVVNMTLLLDVCRVHLSVPIVNSRVKRLS